MSETELPAEVLNKISMDAEALYNELDGKAREVDSYDFGLPMYKKIKKPIKLLLTEYATKLHQAQQDSDKAKLLLAEIKKAYDKGLPTWSIIKEIKTFLDGK